MTLRLRTQYTIAIATLVALASVTLASIVVYSLSRASTSRAETLTRVSSEHLIAEADARASAVSRLIASNIANAYYYYDIEEMENILSAARSEPDIVSTVVFDMDGAAVVDGTGSMAEFGEQVSPELLAILGGGAANKQIVRHSEDVIYVTCPLELGDETVGGVTVGLSLIGLNKRMGQLAEEIDVLNAEAANRGVLAVVLAALLTIAGGVVVASRVADRLSRPIGDVARAAASIGNGAHAVRVEAAGSQEIVELVESFNTMAQDLESSTISLDRLEDVVAERTAQIRTANEQLRAEIGRRELVEEELRQHREELEHIVAERTRRLAESNTQLKREIEERHEAERSRLEMEERLLRAQKMEALGMLAGGVAHDLNNILTGVVSYPELLLRQLPEGSPLASSLETIRSSGERAAAVVQDLLTMARRGVASMEPQNLRVIVDEYLATPEFRSLEAAQPGVAVQTSHLVGDLWISGSRVHVLKSVTNLVQNAFEAIPGSGSIRITTSRADSSDVDIATDAPTCAVIEVADTGTGITTEDLARVYEPFYTKKKLGRSGSGLGMAVVWGTVQDHGGHIDASSLPGEGTTFTISLPEIDAPLARKGDAVQSHAFDGHGERVLVVDDVEEQREVATKLLGLMGYDAVAVASGEEAIAHVRDNECSLLVLDMIMEPGIDGLETYERILEIRPGMPAVIASGFAESERVDKARKLGVSAYIKKPYLAADLGDAIYAALNHHRAETSPSVADTPRS